jgi:hypothetical protein
VDHHEHRPFSIENNDLLVIGNRFPADRGIRTSSELIVGISRK